MKFVPEFLLEDHDRIISIDIAIDLLSIPDILDH